MKTEHIGNLEEIDKSLKAMKAKRAEMLMAFNGKRQRLERDLKKARKLREDLVRNTARRVRRTVGYILDCEPETVGEAITVIQRLSATVELQGCETCLEISNEDYSETLKAAIPLKEMNARPSQKSLVYESNSYRTRAQTNPVCPVVKSHGIRTWWS